MALDLFLDKEGEFGPVLNTSKWIKLLFLSFVQAVFSRYDTFRWYPDRKITKIVIQDKFASSNINPERTPQIIFNRGLYRFARLSTDGMMQSSVLETSKTLNTELIRSSASFSCIARDQATSEHLADFVWLSLLSFRSDLRSKGIHYLNNVDVGESSPIKMNDTGGDVELFETPVFISFDFQLKYWSDFNASKELTYDQIGLIISGYPSEGDSELVLEL